MNNYYAILNIDNICKIITYNPLEILDNYIKLNDLNFSKYLNHKYENNQWIKVEEEKKDIPPLLDINEEIK